MAFSLSGYERLLDVIIESGRKIQGVANALNSTNDPRDGVVMRHDVDRLPGRAARLSEREGRRNIATTYYFRANGSGRFPERAIHAIAGMGHEIGYHYESLSRSGGHLHQALTSFKRDVDALRAIAPCTTICMHGAPLSRHNNMSILDHLDLPALGLKGDAFRDMAVREPHYFTDTGGRWNADRSVNRRDIIGGSDVPVDPSDTTSFRGFLATSPRLVYINVHPERWPGSTIGYVQAAATDRGANLLKRLLRRGQKI